MNSELNGMGSGPTGQSSAGPVHSSAEGEFFDRLVDHCNCVGRVELLQEQWKNDPDSLDYVCVDTQRMVMEKTRFINREAGLSGVRVRFWLKDQNTVVDMHFTPRLECAGWYMPVTMGFNVNSFPYQTETAFVGLAVSAKRKIVVTGEQSLATALSSDAVTEQQAHNWREQLRHLRREFMARRFPPAIVRNFTLVS